MKLIWTRFNYFFTIHIIIIYINLIDQKEPTLNFQNEDNNKTDINMNNNNVYCKKIIKPSLDELQLHKNYLKTNLKKNFF